MNEFLSFEPYRKFIDKRGVAGGPDHSVFAVKPAEYLDFLDGMWKQIRTGDRTFPAPAAIVKEAREGYKYVVVELADEKLGRIGYQPGPTPSWSGNSGFALFIYKDEKTFVTAYPVPFKK
jgi:hypothetical protein